MSVPTPAIPVFTDGTVVHATDLNALGSNLTNLYTYGQASFNSQKPCALIRQTTLQSIADNANATMTFQTAVVNTDSMWSSGAPTQLTIQHAGIYLLQGQTFYVNVAGMTTAQTGGCYLCVNGAVPASNAVAAGAANMSTSNCGPAGNVSCLVNLAAGATVFLVAVQTSGAARNTQTGFGGSYISAIYQTSST